MKIKLREAEGLLKQKELRDRVEEIQSLWESARSDGNTGNASSTATTPTGGSQTAGFLRTSAGLIQSKLRGRSNTTSIVDSAQHLSDKLLEAKLVGQVAELQQKVSTST